MTTQRPTVTEIVDASQDALVERDIDRYVSLLAEDVVLEDPSAPPLRGREAARQFIGAMLAGFSRIEFLDRTVFPFGDRAALRFTIRFTTAAGKQGVFEGVDLIEVNARGEIQRFTSFYDPTALAAALA